MLIIATMFALFTNAQSTQHSTQKDQDRKEIRNTNSAKSQKSKSIKNNDSYLSDYQYLNLSDAQKKKIKALHQRRSSQNAKMKNSKKALSEKQYHQEVQKVLTTDQKQKFKNQQGKKNQY